MTPAMQRESAHAKLLTFGERHVVAYLSRGDDDALSVVLQLWIGASDEQLRLNIDVRGDDRDVFDPIVQEIFEDLTDDTLAAMMQQLRIPELIAEQEATGRDG